MRAAHKAGPTRPLRVAAPRDTQCAPPRWAEELLPPEQRTGGRLESTAGRAPFGPIWPERSRRRLGEFAHRSRRQRRSIECRRRLAHPHRAGARGEVIGAGSRPRTPKSQLGGRLERGARSTVWRRPPPPSAQSARDRTHTPEKRAYSPTSGFCYKSANNTDIQIPLLGASVSWNCPPDATTPVFKAHLVNTGGVRPCDVIRANSPAQGAPLWAPRLPLARLPCGSCALPDL